MEERAREIGWRAFRLGVVPPVALGVLWIFLKDPGITGFFAAGFNHMIYGTAFKPYVYRALLPWTTRVVVLALPDGTTWAVSHWVATTPVAALIFAQLKLDPRFAAEHIVSTILMFACFLGFARAIRLLVTTLYDAPRVVAEAAPVVALVGMQTMFNYSNYVYDPVTLFFSAELLLLLAGKRWWSFVALFAVAMFNKETTIVFAGLFLLHNLGRMPVRRYALFAVLLLVPFTVSRVVLNHLYAGNGGAFTIVQLLGHNLALLHVYPPSSIVTAGVLLALVFGHFHDKPLLLKEGLLMALPLLGACLVVGFFDELRDYYEVYPVILLLGAPTMARWMGAEMKTRAVPPERAPLKAWLLAARTAQQSPQQSPSPIFPRRIELDRDE